MSLVKTTGLDQHTKMRRCAAQAVALRRPHIAVPRNVGAVQQRFP